MPLVGGIGAAPRPDIAVGGNIESDRSGAAEATGFSGKVVNCCLSEAS
jgi:hypothetical protein